MSSVCCRSSGFFSLAPLNRPLRRPREQQQQANINLRISLKDYVQSQRHEPVLPLQEETLEDDESKSRSEDLDFLMQQLKLYEDTRSSIVSFLRPGAPAYAKAELAYSVVGVARPIGLTLLCNGNIAVASTTDNQVYIYGENGKLVGTVCAGVRFRRPSDITSFPDGRFAVRDNNGIQLFDPEGQYIRHLARNELGVVYGLANDGKGNVFTLNFNPHYDMSILTAPGETDVLVIDLVTGNVTMCIKLDDIIVDKRRTKCRFLHFSNKKLYVGDLGLDVIYELNVSRGGIRIFGGSGCGEGQFRDPAGMTTDYQGNIIVADAGNNRLQVFNRKRMFEGVIRLSHPIRRPSGLFFDRDSTEPAVFVLNLNGNSLDKFVLKPMEDM